MELTTLGMYLHIVRKVLYAFMHGKYVMSDCQYSSSVPRSSLACPSSHSLRTVSSPDNRQDAFISSLEGDSHRLGVRSLFSSIRD